VPLLVLLLPLKVEAMGERVGLLTLTAIVGALAASASAIIFGMLGDRSWAKRRSRRRWIVGGLIATVLSYGAIGMAQTPAALIGAIAVFQVAVNMMLSPISTTMADHVPDRAKGVAGGMLAAGQPLGALVGAGVTSSVLGSEAMRLAGVVLCVALLVTPLLLVRWPPIVSKALDARSRPLRRVDLGYLWMSRLCVQIANVVPFTYLLFLFQEVAGRDRPIAMASRLGWLTAAIYLVSVPLALVIGRLSDRIGRRKPFLLALALAGAVGLTTMAVAVRWPVLVAGYAVFAVTSAAFLALQSSYAMEVLPSPKNRGRDLGLLNLANTLPSVVGAALTWSLAPDARFGTVLITLAGLMMIGGLMVLPVRGAR
jgi:MFS family permease